MSARILSFRPQGLVVGEAPSAEPEVVHAYLRGVDAGDRHGYARGRAEALRDLVDDALGRVDAVRDLVTGAIGYLTTPLSGRRSERL